MRLGIPIILKFLVIFFILGVFFWTFNMSFMNIFLLSLFVTALSFVGDMFILPRYGNVFATIADFVLVFVLTIAGSAFFLGGAGLLGWAALTPAILIALSEAFFHKYLRKQFFEDDHPRIDAVYDQFDGVEKFNPGELEHLRTEFSNEFDIGNPEGTDEYDEPEDQKKQKKYVPHKRRKKNKKRPY